MGWDQVLVYFIVIAAALYLLRRSLTRRRSGCDTGCGNCPVTTPEPKQPPAGLIQIETKPRKRLRD